MGFKGYTGVTIHIIKDIPMRVDYFALCQSGNSFTLYNKDFVDNNLDGLMNQMEETNKYIYWWNSHLLDRGD